MTCSAKRYGNAIPWLQPINKTLSEIFRAMKNLKRFLERSYINRDLDQILLNINIGRIYSVQAPLPELIPVNPEVFFYLRRQDH
jgi:hypothetical protein